MLKYVSEKYDLQKIIFHKNMIINLKILFRKYQCKLNSKLNKLVGSKFKNNK